MIHMVFEDYISPSIAGMVYKNSFFVDELVSFYVPLNFFWPWKGNYAKKFVEYFFGACIYRSIVILPWP